MIRLAAGRDSTGLIESYHAGYSMGRVENWLKTKATLLGELKEPTNDGSDKFFLDVRQRVDSYLKQRGWGQLVALSDFANLLIQIVTRLRACSSSRR